jgi:alpha-1,2-mannosyltransferase
MRKEVCAMSMAAPSKSTPELWHRLFIVVLLALFAALSVQYSYKAFQDRGAIGRWYAQLQLFAEGQNIWEEFNYPNPPILAILLMPLTLLPPLYAALFFFYLKVGMTLAVFHWIFRLVEVPEVLFPPWAKALTVLFSLRMIMSDLNHGNVNLFILFLVVAALYAFHRRRDGIAGLTLALAISCKVTPALFVPYLIWKRAWATLIACAAGMLLFLFFVPSLKSGWDHNVRDLNSWLDGMILPYIKEGKVTSEHQNQSLPGLVFRLATHSPSFSDFDQENQYVPLQYDNFVSLEPRQAQWIVRACMLAFVVLVIWRCRTPMTGRQGWRLAAEYSVIILGMLLFSERTWKHHCVTLILPFAVICYCLATAKYGATMRCFLIGCLAAATLLIGSTSTIAAAKEGTSHWVQFWDHFGKSAQVYGAFVWAYLVLLAALVVLLRPQSYADTLPGRRTIAESA